MACPEVVTGRVEIPSENYRRIQSAVDKGRNTWRLSPVRTAQEIGAQHLGLSTNDAYTFVQQYVEAGSGLHHATVRVVHRSCTYLVGLYQPERQGPQGIWVVQDVTEV